MKCFKKSIFVSAIIFFFTVFFWTAAFAADDEIRIGVIGPMKFVQGIGHWNGALSPSPLSRQKTCNIKVCSISLHVV